VKHTFMKCRGFVACGAFLLAACALAWAAGGTGKDGDPQVAVVTPTPAAPIANVPEARTRGIEKALSGRFLEGLEDLRRVLQAAPDDRIAREAADLLSAHLQIHKKADEERQREYADAEQRVEHCRAAQEYVEKAPAEELKTLRKHVKDLAEAYNTSATADDLEEAADKDAVEALKKKGADTLAKTAEALSKAVAIYENRTDRYAETFRAVASQAGEMLGRHAQAWRDVPVTGPGAWRDAAWALKELEFQESDMLADVESMTVEKPWKPGLVQARLARRLAEDKEAMARREWFVRLIAETEERVRRYVKEAEWYDALSAYNALKDLLPDNLAYEKEEKTVQRHVRVLGLYGGKVKSSLPGGEEEEEPQWRDLVANVDADMIEKVIGQLDLAYVSAVDYRKVTRGGLTSVKVLAETPQAASSFPALKDDEKRKKFVAAIDQQLQDVEKRDRVRPEDLVFALNGVLRASEQSVEIPTEVLAVEFADGFLDELDPFSSMIWPHDVPNFEKQTMGEFFGVGIQITKEPGEPLRVVTPLIGTPAFRAGIKSGDLIVKVANPPQKARATDKMSLDKLVDMIMGEKDTPVILTIKRGGRTMEVSVIRDRIRIRTVKGWHREEGTGEWDFLVDPKGHVGYVRLTQFTAQTAEHLATALRDLRDKGIRSVVLDLRFNPGGLLRSAAQVADEFLSSGLIVSTQGRRTRARPLPATSSGSYLDGDLIVLINQYSASAAEIVSGALQDWKRARAVGERTYGKGSVQNVIPIPGHSARLKLTTAYYYLPKGRLLHRKNGAKDWGVDPDVEVDLTPAQIRRWLDIRRKTDIVQDGQSEQLEKDLERQYQADVQLNMAVLMLKLMRLQYRSAV